MIIIDTIFTAIAIFSTFYFIGTTVGSLLTLGKYDWFSNLEDKIEAKFPKYTSLISKMFGFKLFYCSNCMSFWTTLIMLILLGFFVAISPLDILQISFIVYLFNVAKTPTNDFNK